ncbi:MAG: ABC transporter substrate-binding protein, partial [Pseudomonadales bacterium]|nr:ABC transporter substrate-binding protein [Pseudomonadales bacterium]
MSLSNGAALNSTGGTITLVSGGSVSSDSVVSLPDTTLALQNDLSLTSGTLKTKNTTITTNTNALSLSESSILEVEGVQDLSGVTFPDDSTTLRLAADTTLNDTATWSVRTLDLSDFALTLDDQMGGLTVAQQVTMDAAGEQILTGAADLSLDGGIIVNAGTLSSSGGLVSASSLSAGGTGVLNFQGGTLSLPDGATLVGGATFTTSGATLNLGRSLAVADTWTSTNTSISLTADTTLTSTNPLTVKTVENVGKYSLTLGSDTTDLTISEGITINDPSGQDRSLGDTGDPIIIPTHNWSSQIVMSHVVGQLFEKMGYSVEYTSTDGEAVYEAVRLGNAHLELEVWESSFATSFNAALVQGGIHDAGTHAAGTREEWWYPAYVADLCPGLPDWEALAACSAQFARADSGGKGVFIDGPVGWEHDNSRIEALGMDFIVKHVDEASGLWAELESAAQANTPIVMFNWSPNFTDALYGGAFVEFPDFHEKGYLKKAAWDGMPTKWPAAYNALTRINFTTNQIGAMALY